MAFKYYLIGLCIIIQVAMHPPYATITLSSSNSDKAAFVKILNRNTYGKEPWTYSNNTFVHTGNPATSKISFYSHLLLFDIVQKPENITLKLGRDLPGVLFGSFTHGSGNNT